MEQEKPICRGMNGMNLRSYTIINALLL
jgi:hypothetical protein